MKPELIKVLNMKGFAPLEGLAKINSRFISTDGNLEMKESYRHTSMRKLAMNKMQNFGSIMRIGNNDPNEDDIMRFSDDAMLEENLLFEILEFFGNNELNYDVFTDELLRISDKLMRFELYGMECTDYHKGYVIRNPNSSFFSVKKMDLIRFLKSISGLYFNIQSPVNPIGSIPSKKRFSMFTKSETEEKVNVPKKARKSNFLSNLLNDPTSLTDPIIRCASNLRNFLYSLKQTNTKKVAQKNFEPKIKIRVCKIMHYYLDTRQEYLISNITK